MTSPEVMDLDALLGPSLVVATGEPCPGLMSTLREKLHELIDRLPESQVAPILAIMRESSLTGGDQEWPLPDFVGTLSSGKGDLATRSSEILRAELGRKPE